ncbi:hypothetical protein F4821DRAFT_230193 [Hypoxylon rubiginosum]|uniref:Uncharacterized protein n=1 Tax=Hypoxylon rubiginosum TaxID=110542 RepID=A0ACC0DB15_9PEZI|nr:hypothetical protein F4821DRAFT_230193 [Hypoxylon rubiginosum]
MIVNRLGIHDQLRLLAAYPTAFRDGRINILAIRAARERVLVNSGPPGPPGPGDNNDDVEPMLSSAIRGQNGQPNHPLHIITEILDAYDEALGRANSVDAIYLNRTHTPALFLAIRTGRADLVRLLLDRGASIDIAHNGIFCGNGESVHLYTMCRSGTRCRSGHYSGCRPRPHLEPMSTGNWSYWGSDW